MPILPFLPQTPISPRPELLDPPQLTCTLQTLAIMLGVEYIRKENMMNI